MPLALLFSETWTIALIAELPSAPIAGTSAPVATDTISVEVPVTGMLLGEKTAPPIQTLFVAEL